MKYMIRLDAIFVDESMPLCIFTTPDVSPYFMSQPFELSHVPSTPEEFLGIEDATSPSRHNSVSTFTQPKSPSRPAAERSVVRHPRKITAHEAVDLLGSCGASRENCECGMCFIMKSKGSTSNEGPGTLTLNHAARGAQFTGRVELTLWRKLLRSGKGGRGWLPKGPNGCQQHERSVEQGDRGAVRGL